MEHSGFVRLVMLVGVLPLGAAGCVPDSPEQTVGDLLVFAADFARQLLAAWLF
jgi:hypothetical protein